jgi:hypothetical protein
MSPRAATSTPSSPAEKKLALCTLAKKMPSELPKTGNSNVDAELPLIRNAFINCIDMMWKNPAIVLSTERFLDDKLDRLHTEAQKKDAEHFAQDIKTLCTLFKDEVWAIGFLKLLGFKQDFLEKIKRFDPDSPKHLMVYLLAMSLTTRLPSELQATDACAFVLNQRIVDIQRFGPLLAPGAVIADASGKIRWPQIGVYGLVVDDEGVVTRIVHRPTGDHVAVPASSPITTSWTLKNNWSDLLAKVEMEAHDCEHFLHKWFQKDKLGPYKVIVFKGAEKGFKTFVAETLIKMKNAKDVVDSTRVQRVANFNKDPDEEKKRKAGEKARTALKQRKIELDAKRKDQIAVEVVA